MEDKLFNAQELLGKITRQLKSVDDLLNYSDETIWFDPNDITTQVTYDNKPDEGFMVYTIFEAGAEEAVVKKPLYPLLEEWMELFTCPGGKYDKDDTNKYLNDLDDIVSKLRGKVAEVGIYEET
jgi:hypothetical protein